MRGTGLGMVALAFAAATVPAVASAAPAARDHSWVRSHAVLFYARPGEPGLYRLRLNRNGTERVLDTGQFKVYEVRLQSGRSTWINIRASRYATQADERNGASPAETTGWLYDLGTGRTVEIRGGNENTVPVFSADASRAAWLTRDGSAWHVTVMATATLSLQTSPFEPVTGPTPFIHDVRWSHDGQKLLFVEQRNLLFDSLRNGWTFDPDTAKFASADLNAEPPVPEKRPHFTVSSCPIMAEYCSTACWDDQAVQSIALGNGIMAFMADDQHLLLKRPHGVLETVASRPMPPDDADDPDYGNGCGIALSIYAAFEERYVLYRKRMQLIIYDVVSRRRAVILDNAAYVSWLP